MVGGAPPTTHPADTAQFGRFARASGFVGFCTVPSPSWAPVPAMGGIVATTARIPAQLAYEGLRLWSEITSSYDLRPDEVRVLADACREADIVERLEVELRDEPLMVKGSQGQLVASPLVSEVRQHRTVLSALLKALKLPDTNATAKQKDERVSEQARKAARARWERPRVS